jgi:hypothetical protein
MTWPFSASDNAQDTPQKLPHQPRKDCGLIPQGAVLLGVLKAIECELRARHQLGSSSSEATPLWFLAETERNLYLWISGVGLANAGSTVFWVNISALITKRKRQLLRHFSNGATGGFNPFITRDSYRSAELGDLDSEFSYLDELARLDSAIFKRAAMISRISDSLHDELIPLGGARKRVVLPVDIKQARREPQG